VQAGIDTALAAIRFARGMAVTSNLFTATLTSTGGPGSARLRNKRTTAPRLSPSTVPGSVFQRYRQPLSIRESARRMRSAERRVAELRTAGLNRHIENDRCTARDVRTNDLVAFALVELVSAPWPFDVGTNERRRP
jgi:hypothetical protein